MVTYREESPSHLRRQALEPSAELAIKMETPLAQMSSRFWQPQPYTPKQLIFSVFCWRGFSSRPSRRPPTCESTPKTFYLQWVPETVHPPSQITRRFEFEARARFSDNRPVTNPQPWNILTPKVLVAGLEGSNSTLQCTGTRLLILHLISHRLPKPKTCILYFRAIRKMVWTEI